MMESQLAPCNNLSGKALWCPHTQRKANPNKCPGVSLLGQGKAAPAVLPSFLLPCSHSNAPAEAPPQGHPAPHPCLIRRVRRDAQQGRVPGRAAWHLQLPHLDGIFPAPPKSSSCLGRMGKPHPETLVATRDTDPVSSFPVTAQICQVHWLRGTSPTKPSIMFFESAPRRLLSIPLTAGQNRVSSQENK